MYVEIKTAEKMANKESYKALFNVFL